MKKIIAILVFAAAAFSAYSKTSVFTLDCFPGPVYYDAAKAMEDGDGGETVVIMIHGWGGGLTYLAEQESLENALDGIYVIALRFPRLETFRERNVENDGRPRWNDSWTPDLTKYGNASDGWRGGGDANGFRFSSSVL